MAGTRCRACRGSNGDVVLDLGDQPASDYFPALEDPGPDPVYPLQMWLCATCGLAQLLADPTTPEEPRGAEPAALTAQAADAVRQVADAGWLPAGARVAEYGSPHGGSWSALLTDRGMSLVQEGGEADAVLDCFGMMHHADQALALRERAGRVAAGGVLLLQYHSLATILRRGQWNALRHGHYAYYSMTALAEMLQAVGFTSRMTWQFDLYGGTILLAATRDVLSPAAPDQSVGALIAAERQLGVRDVARVRRLQRVAESSAAAVRHWLAEQQAAKTRVLGYGAASRAVALLCRAEVDNTLLPAVADASPAKQGRRMPGTNIPVISPDELTDANAVSILVLLPDLLTELRKGFPQIETTGGCWIDVESLGTRSTET